MAIHSFLHETNLLAINRALDPQRTQVKLSFWGRREVVFIPTGEILPLYQVTSTFLTCAKKPSLSIAERKAGIETIDKLRKAYVDSDNLIKQANNWIPFVLNFFREKIIDTFSSRKLWSIRHDLFNGILPISLRAFTRTDFYNEFPPTTPLPAATTSLSNQTLYLVPNLT